MTDSEESENGKNQDDFVGTAPGEWKVMNSSPEELFADGGSANAMRHNRTVYDAEIADIARSGKQIRIVKRIKAGSPLETVEDVETMDVAQARELRDSLTEAIDRV